MTYHWKKFACRASVMVVIAVSYAGAQTVSFVQGKPAYPAIGATALSTGDFNADGVVDAIAATPFAMSVYPGNTNGSFGAPISTTLKFSCINSLLITDFNRDGKLDFACLLANSFQVALGNGDGTFRTPIVTSFNGLQVLNAGDFNGDGIPDLVSYTPNSLIVFFGKGNGLFVPPVTTPVTEGSFSSIHPADVDGDGKSDIVATRGDAVLLLTGRGDGGFQIPVILALKGASADSVASADLNGDGKLDLVIALNRAAVNLPVPHIAVLIQGAGGLFTPSYYVSPNPLFQLQLADVTGDGMLDVIGVTTTGPPTVTVFKSKPGGTLANPIAYSVPAKFFRVANPRHNVLPDVIFSDGDTVALLPNDGSGSFKPGFQVQQAVSAAPCLTGDFDNDGQSDLACLDSYFITILYGTGVKTKPLGRKITVQLIGPATAISAGDFNNDGNLDIEAALVDGTLQYIENQGAAGFFQPQRRFNGGHGLNVLASGDFNNDGKLDLLTGGGNLLLGAGDGTFGPPAPFYSGTFQYFGVADLNGDGTLDVVGIPGGQLPPVILLGLGNGQFDSTVLTGVNGGHIPVIADLNNDGTLDIVIPADNFGVTILLNSGSGAFVAAAPVFNDFWPPTVSVAVGDFNRDGKPDIVFGLQSSSIWPVAGNGDGTFQPTNTGFSVEDSTSLNRLLFTGTGIPNPSLLAGSTVTTFLESR